jgi:hypothetical protein
MIRLAIILGITYSFTSAFATDNKYYYLGLQTHYGFIIEHSREVSKISKSKPWGFQMDFGWHYATEKAWSYCHCFPKTGFMLSYFNFNNRSVLGSGFGVTPYIEPFLSAHKSFSISIKAGLGLIYLNNVYHPLTNPENNFYSMSISALLHGSIAFQYRIIENFSLKTALNYNHISNGSLKQPNKGINFPLASIGVDYTFGSPLVFPPLEKDDYNIEYKKRFSIRVSPYFTTKEISKEDKKQYPIFGAAAKVSYLVGRLSAISTGLDYTWDSSLAELAIGENINDSSRNRLSLTLGHELLIGKVNFYQDLGIYLYSPYKPLDAVFQRYGIEYFIIKNLSLGVNLKAHRHVADFLDFRATISF